jgi:hypothetical protein
MLIFFVMLVLLLHTVRGRQFWGTRRAGMLKSISSPAWNYNGGWLRETCSDPFISGPCDLPQAAHAQNRRLRTLC